MALELDKALATGDPFLIYANVRQLECELGGKPFDVYKFQAEEDMFSSFTARVTVVANRRLESRDILDKYARVKVKGMHSDRDFHGMVVTFEELSTRGKYYLFRATVVSDLWVLSRIRNLRIFQHLTVPQIIEEVLKTSRIFPGRYDMRFKHKYKPREYCVQYRETNMDFIKRLMAEEGMFFYHEYKDNKHRPVFSDSSAFCNKISGQTDTVLYSKKGQLVNIKDHITEFDASDRLTLGKVHLMDYHFERPSVLPQVEHQDENPTFFSLYDYPGFLDDEPTADRLSRVHLERDTFQKRMFRGRSVCRHLSAGHRFTLTGHSHGDYNREYIVTAVRHRGHQPQVMRELEGSEKGSSYSNEFTCIPSDVTFRPERPLSKPSVMGLQSAVVTGPENEEIYTDTFGRVKVKFHWDLLGKEERTSCWLRVAQSWAGACESIFIPRIGQEVLVAFIDGDPDRPIVVGAVYNGNHMPPYNLPAEKTKSTIKSHTVKGEGFNELRFEDKKDHEEIYIHGQKDWNIEILNDKTQTIGHDEKLDVKNDRTKTIGHDQKEDIKNDKTITVAKNHTESIGENMKITIGKNLDESTGDNKTATVGKNLDETVGDDAKINIGKNRSVNVSENNSVDVGKEHRENIGTDSMVTVGENFKISVGNNYTISVNEKTSISSGKEMVLTCGNASIILKSNGNISINGKDIDLTGSGNVVVKGKNIAGN